MRLFLVLIVIAGIGLVVGGSAGRTIAETAIGSSTGAADTNGDSQVEGPSFFGRNFGGDPQKNTNPILAQEDPPQDSHTLTSDARTSIESGGIIPTTPKERTASAAEPPILNLRSDEDRVYQLSRRVDSSLTVELRDAPSAGDTDTNDDGFVNEKDLVQVAGAFGSSVAEASPLDVNGDGRIDIMDLATVAAHLGEQG